MSGQFSLLRRQRFLPLFITQFLGAFNDNVFKNALVILITFRGSQLSSVDPALLVNACAGIFILPFFLFSATAGQLADKYEKAGLIRRVKQLEIAIMLIAALGFWQSSLNCLLAALFLMGTHSALFGPLKYSILPQHLAAHELTGGNALIEAGTFVAILLGTIVGGTLIAMDARIGAQGAPYTSVACLGFAMLGYLASRRVPRAPAPAPELPIQWNVLAATWRGLDFARRDRTVLTCIIGISWFWFYGALFLSQFPGFTKNHLGGDESTVTLMLALFSVGIGIGSLLCEKLSRQRIELGLVALGAIGLSVFAMDLYLASPASAAGAFVLADNLRILADLVLIGASGGLFCVPLYTLIQSHAESTHRSRTIAANNIVNALFMVAAALLAMLLLGAGCSIPQLFLLTALLNTGVGLYLCRAMPAFGQRLIALLRRGV